jgi:hypothetical protein
MDISTNEKVFKMFLTLADIDAMFPETKDGSLYSDLYKDVYGSRPRYVTFVSMQEFDEDFAYLNTQAERQISEQKVEQHYNFEAFIARVDETMKLVEGSTRTRAIEIIADAVGLSADELSFYGYEVLEYELGIKFGSIKQWLTEEAK